MPVIITVKNEETGIVSKVKKTPQMMEWLSQNKHLKVSEPEVIKVEPIKKNDAQPVNHNIVVDKVVKEDAQAQVIVTEKSVQENEKKVDELNTPKRGRPSKLTQA